MRVTYVMPEPVLCGGNKVVIQHAHLLSEAGCAVTLVGLGPRPTWCALRVPYVDYQASPPRLPTQDVVVGTFWSTLARARGWELGRLAHFCQGYEGSLVHLAPVLPEIEAAYAEPLPTLTVTPFLAEFLSQRFARQCRVTPPPLDALFRPRWRLRPRARPWLAVPGLFESHVKGVEVALAAVLRLRARGLDCRLLRSSTLPLGDAERELLPPHRYLCNVPPPVLARALRACDLLLFPSRPGEGFGLPLLEALASGVPAVASRLPSTEFMGAVAVTLVPPDDPEALADAAEALLREPRAWRAARRAGRAAAQAFAPAVVGPQVLEAVTWASSSLSVQVKPGTTSSLSSIPSRSTRRTSASDRKTTAGRPR